MRLPNMEISQFQKRFNDLGPKIPKVKGMQSIPDDKEHKIAIVTKRTEELNKYIEEKGFEVKEQKLFVGYDNMSLSEVLR